MNFLRIAEKEAYNSTNSFRIGACCAKSGRVLGSGFNQLNKTNKLVRQFFGHPTLHAEIASLLHINPENIKGSTIFVYRLGSDNSPRLSAPCERCMNAMISLGVKKVIYTINESPFYEIVKLN